MAIKDGLGEWLHRYACEQYYGSSLELGKFQWRMNSAGWYAQFGRVSAGGYFSVHFSVKLKWNSYICAWGCNKFWELRGAVAMWLRPQEEIPLLLLVLMEFLTLITSDQLPYRIENWNDNAMEKTILRTDDQIYARKQIRQADGRTITRWSRIGALEVYQWIGQSGDWLSNRITDYSIRGTLISIQKCVIFRSPADRQW